jgi:anti-sigma factor RsiW
MQNDGSRSTDELLHGYVDDMLPPRERLEVEEYLTSHPEALERVRAYQKQNSELHAEYDRYLGAELPPEVMVLGNRLRGRVARSGRKPRFRRAAAYSTLVAAGLLGGVYVANGLDVPSTGSQLVALLDRGTELISRYALPGAGEDPLRQANIDAAPSGSGVAAPNLSEYGFHLVESRILAGRGGAETIQLTYDSDKRGQLLLYFTPAASRSGSEQKVSLNQEGPVSILTWSDAERSYSMISETLDRNAMLTLGKAVIGSLTALPSTMDTPAKDVPKKAPPALPTGDGSDKASIAAARNSTA